MTADPSLPRVKDVAAAHPEVEFALVLARTIDAVSGDPEQLRSAVYELARHKLQQLSADDPAEKARLMQALEVAIAGVETHVTAGPQTLPRQQPLLATQAPQPTRLSVSLIESSQASSALEHGSFEREALASGGTESVGAARRLLSSLPARVAAVLLFVVVIVIGITSARRHAVTMRPCRAACPVSASRRCRHRLSPSRPRRRHCLKLLSPRQQQLQHLPRRREILGCRRLTAFMPIARGACSSCSSCRGACRIHVSPFRRRSPSQAIRRCRTAVCASSCFSAMLRLTRSTRLKFG
ncbi:hypothetical protein BRAO375_1700026 [Bradyrhizobium sp. ORS 375]|nr:hypothetical protein BRAO375_1700026 [Bradyrhizobium sp. ORS 375]